MSAGTTVKLSNNVTGLLVFVCQCGQDDVSNYGVQFGLNVALGQPAATAVPGKAPRV